jgi:hypothetical protein
MKKILYLLPLLFMLLACGAQPAPTQDVSNMVNATLTAIAQNNPQVVALQPTVTSISIQIQPIATQVVPPAQSLSPSVTPSPSAVHSSNQAPSSSIDPTWKKYTNAQVGFSIQYPSYWQEKTLPDENPGRHNIDLKGTEGEVELIWGTGLGGACPEGYQPLAVAKGNLPACHTQRADGTDLWSLATQSLGNTGLAGFVSTNDTTTKSREVVLQVVSTLIFP